jgi:hypothetical protein
MPVIPALRRLRQENHEFKASLGCMLRPCVKKGVRHMCIHVHTYKYVYISAHYIKTLLFIPVFECIREV